MTSDPIVIVAAKRTPMGGLQGSLTALSAPQLGGGILGALLAETKWDPARLAEVYMGCVLPAGLGQAPARQAARLAQIPDQVGATTINKMCGSGLKAIMLATDQLLAGNGESILAGGMESMTNAPYLLPRARSGYRLGHGEVKDHMFLDGLEDAYDRGTLMGVFAENTATKYGFTREAQDEFALTSLSRAQHAQEAGLFKDEMVPITAKTRKETITIDFDDGPKNAKPEKIPNLKPAFAEGGTVTAANSSSISDGASAVLLMPKSVAEQANLPILATILGHHSHAQEPAWFTTAPAAAVKGVLDKVNWTVSDVDLFEINEAFAVVTLAAMKDLDIPHDKVNIHGGACALGHPIGASGARILVTLIHALRHEKLKRGIASLCIGGGEAVAVAIEVA